MARRHSTAESHPLRGQQHPEQGEQSSNEWHRWSQNRTPSPQLYHHGCHYSAQERRGSAPDFLNQPSGSYTSTFLTAEPAYTATSRPLNPGTGVNLAPRSSLPTIEGLSAPDHHEVLSHRGRSHNIDPTIIKGDRDRNQQLPSLPLPTAFGPPLPHEFPSQFSRFDNLSPPSADGESPPISSPQHSPSSSTYGSDREALTTCELDEPGCFVLVPPGTNPAENPKPTRSRNRENNKPMAGKGSGRRRTDELERQAIKRNRKHGVCLRCKIYKEKCRGGIPCERCLSLKLWKSICVPAQFKEKAVFNRVIYRGRVVSLLENVRIWDVEMAGSVPLGGEIFEVHNGYSPSLQLKAYQFVPHDETLLQHIVWRVSGSPDFTRLPSTCYGIKEEISPETFDEYLDKHVQSFINDELRPSSDEVPIFASTMRAAQEYAQGNKNLSVLVQKVLRIWVAQTFFFRSSWRICGVNTLGMEPINDPEMKFHGFIPLPRLINQQLDAQLELRVATMENELLTELQNHILDRNSTDWFGIFLTIFVHLSSIERDTWGLNTWEHDGPTLQERFLQLNIKNSQSNPSKAFLWPLGASPSMLIGKNARLAEMLVSHFRTVSRGFVPFAADWDQNQASQVTGHEKEAVEYLKTMSQQAPKLEQYLALRQAAQYSRDDCDSLSGKFTSKLMISDHLDS